MKNITAKTSWKAGVIVIAIILIAYGYYGYIYVPSQSTAFGEGPFCPFGSESSSPYYGAEPCAFSLFSLVIGIILIVALIGITFIKK